VAVNASGVASTTTTFAAAGHFSLTAVFTPSDSAAYNTSTGTLALRVKASASGTGTIPVSVTVPCAGGFTLTVDTADIVTLTVSRSSATAATTPIVVSDTRNTYPGWSVSGQDSDWTGSGAAAGASISGNQLGWQPTSSKKLPQGVRLGPPVAPASPGLGSTPAVLASASDGPCNGYGTITLIANLTLLIPASQAPGPYSSGLTITAVTSAELARPTSGLSKDRRYLVDRVELTSGNTHDQVVGGVIGHG
jgi:hypothetical protein